MWIWFDCGLLQVPSEPDRFGVSNRTRWRLCLEWLQHGLNHRFVCGWIGRSRGDRCLLLYMTNTHFEPLGKLMVCGFNYFCLVFLFSKVVYVRICDFTPLCVTNADASFRWKSIGYRWSSRTENVDCALHMFFFRLFSGSVATSSVINVCRRAELERLVWTVCVNIFIANFRQMIL